MKTFYISTLGCKVNQYESDGIASDLVRRGWHQATDCCHAQVCIINTCTVTSRAAMQSRQEIRRLIRSNPEAGIVVTGCHAQTEPEQIQAIETVHHIAGHAEKFCIPDTVESSVVSGNKKFHSAPMPVASRRMKVPFHSFEPAVIGQKTRAYLKIQDGCNAACTYCIVPIARGRSSSMPVDEVIEHLRVLNTSGFKEAVLTGIHIGSYGIDLQEPDTFSSLLKTIAYKKPIHRIRMSSIEPNELNDDILETAFHSNMVCDHFHIPLQSGDDDVLSRMRRPYTSSFFKKLVLKIHDIFPLAGIGVDLLHGFPGESVKAFERTVSLINELPISYLHVFPFSPRPGTPAFSYPDKVPEKTIKGRCLTMRTLGEEKRREFERKNLGAKLEAVIQNERDQVSGRLIAMTSNYLSIQVDGDDKQKGDVATICLETIDSNRLLFGRIL